MSQKIVSCDMYEYGSHWPHPRTVSCTVRIDSAYSCILAEGTFGCDQVRRLIRFDFMKV